MRDKKLLPMEAAQAQDCMDISRGLCLWPWLPFLCPTPWTQRLCWGILPSGTALTLAVPTPRGVQEPTCEAPSCV